MWSEMGPQKNMLKRAIDRTVACKQESNGSVLSINLQEACRKLLFSDGTRTAIVMLSLLTLFPIGIISIVFWILVSIRYVSSLQRTYFKTSQ